LKNIFKLLVFFQHESILKVRKWTFLYFYFAGIEKGYIFATRNPCTAHVKRLCKLPGCGRHTDDGLTVLTVYQTPFFILL